MTPGTFQCAECDGVFDKRWADGEAHAERQRNFPSVPLVEMVLVCDDCYREIMEFIMIVKCQRSLYNSAAATRALFYNKDNSWWWEGDLTDEWGEHFGPTTSPDDNRFFAEVLWRDRHQPPTFIRRLSDQNW